MATARFIAEEVLKSAIALGEEAERLFLPDIAEMIPVTIREMVMDIADQGNQGDRKLLQKSFTVAITPASPYNTADLTSSTAGTDKMYIHLPFPTVMHDDAQEPMELLYKPDEENLNYVTLEDGFDYYAVEGYTVYIYSLVALTGNLVIRSFYFPEVTTLPAQFETELINRLLVKIGMVRR